MSEPRSEKNNPEAPEDPQQPISPAAEPSEWTGNSRPSKVAPWTSEVPQVPGPAPIIELEAQVDSGPVKPLGPRRLARLQREMAAHAEEIHEAEQSSGGEVDQDLLLKQQRFAELALRASAANEQARQDAETALRAAEAQSTGGSEAESEGSPGQDIITVSFPQSSPLGSSLAADPVTGDPGQFPSSPIVPSSGPHTVSINLVPAAPAQREAKTPTASETWTEKPGEEPGDGRDDTAHAAAASHHRQAEREPGQGTVAEPARGEGTEAPPVETPWSPEPVPSEHVSPPGVPVRAVDAEGLELLDPKDYQQKSGALVPLLVLLFLVIAALLAVLIIFVL